MDVKHYLYHFAHLHTAKLKGMLAPHKAVLLLAVMRLVERGSIISPEIELTDELKAEFKKIWYEKLPASCPFTCDISKPFFHMQHESFWRLIEHDENYYMVAEDLGLYSENKKSMTKGYSINAMREQFRCAKIDNELYDVLRNKECRNELENLLVSKYLSAFHPPMKGGTLISLIGATLFFVA